VDSPAPTEERWCRAHHGPGDTINGLVEVRKGLSSGETVVTAARVQSIAPPGATERWLATARARDSFRHACHRRRALKQRVLVIIPAPR